MRKLYEDTSSLTYTDLARRKDTKKDNAQKFYSLLVLQKVHIFQKESKECLLPLLLFISVSCPGH